MPLLDLPCGKNFPWRTCSAFLSTTLLTTGCLRPLSSPFHKHSWKDCFIRVLSFPFLTVYDYLAIVCCLQVAHAQEQKHPNSIQVSLLSHSDAMFFITNSSALSDLLNSMGKSLDPNQDSSLQMVHTQETELVFSSPGAFK